MAKAGTGPEGAGQASGKEILGPIGAPKVAGSSQEILDISKSRFKSDALTVSGLDCVEVWNCLSLQPSQRAVQDKLKPTYH